MNTDNGIIVPKHSSTTSESTRKDYYQDADTCYNNKLITLARIRSPLSISYSISWYLDRLRWYLIMDQHTVQTLPKHYNQTLHNFHWRNLREPQVMRILLNTCNHESQRIWSSKIHTLGDWGLCGSTHYVEVTGVVVISLAILISVIAICTHKLNFAVRIIGIMGCWSREY